MSEINQNEIRDYIERAPKRCYFDGRGIVWNTHARLVWLASLVRGSIHERINRRAGIVEKWCIWKLDPVAKAHKRHRNNEFRKKGIRIINR
jgi:hypothetical protein